MARHNKQIRINIIKPKNIVAILTTNPINLEIKFSTKTENCSCKLKFTPLTASLFQGANKVLRRYGIEKI